MKYLYIHGLNSTGENSSKELCNILNEEVIPLKWNSECSYRTNVDKLQEQIENYSNEDIVLIGSSLGGFYTRILSNVNNLPCVLINPVMDIKESFEVIKNIPFYANITSELIKSYDLAMVADIVLPRVVIVGLKDTIIDPKKTIEFWKNKCNLIISENEEHQIKNFEPFREVIKNL